MVMLMSFSFSFFETASIFCLNRLRSAFMPPSKRTALQHFNPVKSQAVDLLSDPQSPPEDDDASNPAVMDLGAQDPQVENTAPTAQVHPESPSQHAVLAGETRPSIPKSPVSTRDRFLAGFLPARTCCNLELCRAPAGAKFNISGICISVYPAVTNPDRRYIQLADSTGSVGITVWNANVMKFSTDSVGALVSLNKVSISSHHGKKQLTMTRDSIVDIASDTQHSVSQWWQQLLKQVPKSCGSVHDIADNDIVAVSGICGHVTSEQKMVNGAEKTLTTVHLVDSSGRLDIRSWNHMPDAFLQYVDRPIVVKRVRVTSFAGQKMCELLDGSGSVIESDFPGQAALAKFWAS